MLRLSSHLQGPGISMELSKDSTYDEVCEALTERLREEGQAEALHLEDPQQLRFTGQQSWTATIPKTAPFKWRQWDALHQVNALRTLSTQSDCRGTQYGSCAAWCRTLTSHCP